MHELLGSALRLVQDSGMPVELWESLLDEEHAHASHVDGGLRGELANSLQQASFSVRHYFMASPALRQLGGSGNLLKGDAQHIPDRTPLGQGAPLADSFPRALEKDIAVRSPTGLLQLCSSSCGTC